MFVRPPEAGKMAFLVSYNQGYMRMRGVCRFASIFGSIFFGLMPGIIKFVIDHSEFVREVIPLNAAQIERIIFGLFIVGFLMFEPRGLWGIWFRLRNYFKAWPFSY